jgi:mono/diheme cytochrome c family protein
MRQFVFGVLFALVILTAAGYAYLALGMAPVATAAAPLPFEKRITGMALQAAVDKQAPKTALLAPSEAVYLAGAGVYRANCAVCHGLPGQEQTAIAKGEFPKPPNLFKGKGVSDDPAGVTYWKVANGIRLTGMPGFQDSLSPNQMWQVSQLLANSDKLPDSVQSMLRSPLPQ